MGKKAVASNLDTRVATCLASHLSHVSLNQQSLDDLRHDHFGRFDQLDQSVADVLLGVH